MELAPEFKYKSRNFTSLRVYSFDAGGTMPIHGAYWSGEEEGWIPISWHDDGRVDKSRKSPLDLVLDNTEIAA